MTHESRFKRTARLMLALFMIVTGVGHFVAVDAFASIVPAWLPAPRLLVYVSGVAELAGAIGLLIPRVQRAAALGLILLYIAVFPANVNMALHHITPPGVELPSAFLWGRLPFQALFMAWAWWLSRPTPAPGAPERA